MWPPTGSTDAHGHELHIGTNCLGSYLLHELLQPILAQTAATSPAGSVRVAWAGSTAIDLLSPKPGAMQLDDAGKPLDKGVPGNCSQSKVGNLFLAGVLARETHRSGVAHACFNPGNLRTELQRYWTGLGRMLTVSYRALTVSYPVPS